MAASFIIYMLVDPRDYRPYYIGETEDRVKRHRFHCQNSSRNTAVARRCKEIIEEGNTPLMIVLEDAENEVQALIRELFWIELFMSKGTDLCNRENQAYLYDRYNKIITEDRIERKTRRLQERREESAE